MMADLPMNPPKVGYRVGKINAMPISVSVIGKLDVKTDGLVTRCSSIYGGGGLSAPPPCGGGLTLTGGGYPHRPCPFISIYPSR